MCKQVSEASVVDLRVDGSLIVESDSVMGQPEPALPVGSNAIRPRDQQLANTDLWCSLPPVFLPFLPSPHLWRLILNLQEVSAARCS